MPVTLPPQFGKADWTDYVDHWREQDAEWLQSRTILRYADTSNRATGLPTPATGQVTYNQGIDRLEYYSAAGRWLTLGAAENLVTSPTTAANADEEVKFTHKSAVGGVGISLQKDVVAITTRFNVLDIFNVASYGMTLRTGISNRLVTFTTDATSLVIDSPVKFASLSTTTTAPFEALGGVNLGPAPVSPAIRTDTVTTLLTTKVDIAGSQMTGPLLLPAVQSTDLNSAVTRAFVLAEDTKYLPLIGGVLTGQVSGITPTSPANLTRKDYVDAQAAARLALTGGTVAGMLTVHPPSSDTCLRLNATAPIAEFRSADGVTRYAYARGGTAGMTLAADVGDIHCYVGGVEQLHIDANNVIFGKTASDTNNNGVEIWSGSANAGAGRIVSTISSDTAVTNLVLKHLSTSDANGKYFAIFQRSTSSTTCGSITQTGTSGTAFNVSSDYRLKDDLGLIENPLDRLMLLRPKHLSWKDGSGEFDGFLAHEVDEIVPYAVTGDKDAVKPDDDPFEPGGIDPQQFDASKLMALVVGSVQYLARVIEGLKSESQSESSLSE